MPKLGKEPEPELQKSGYDINEKLFLAGKYNDFMISVLIKTESHYTIDRARVRAMIEKVLHVKGVKGSVEISVSIIGDRLMKKLNEKYRQISETTDVLSFPLADEIVDQPFADPPDNILRLGDIVISYPQAREDALEENKLVDDKIDELVEHSMLHLLGQHHE